MANEANIKAIITADDKASGVLKGFANHVDSVGSSIASGLKVAAAGLAVAGAAAVGFGVHALKAFDEAEKGIAQTNAVLASTQGVAGITAKAVDDLSKALQKSTTFSDEEVRSAENLLLTFTSIGKDIFPQATKTVLNMATALGEDTKSASIQLGKALQDPIRGITALHRVGVNFTDKQQDVIKSLVESGKQAEAQKLILKELETEFGNSAEAARHTFGGSLKALKNQLNDVEEQVGGVIKNALQPFVIKAADFVSSIDWEKVINRSIQVIKDLWREIITLRDKLSEIATKVGDYLAPKFEALVHTIRDDVFPTLKKLWEEVLQPLIEKLGPLAGVGLVWAIGEAIDGFNLLLDVASKIVNWAVDHKDFLLPVIVAFVALKTAMMLGEAFDAIKLGFATFQLVQVPSMIATLGVLRAAFIAAFPMAAIAIAATAAFEIIRDQADKTLKVLDKTRQAIDKSTESSNAAAQRVTDLYKQGKISKEQYQKTIGTIYGTRASGGDVQSGRPYFVGEQGMELVIPKQSGTVIPNDKLKGMGGTVNISINAGAFMGSDIEARKFAQLIWGHLQDARSMKGAM